MGHQSTSCMLGADFAQVMGELKWGWGGLSCGPCPARGAGSALVGWRRELVRSTVAAHSAPNERRNNFGEPNGAPAEVVE